MFRTVMVAGQTAGAAAVVVPDGEAVGQRDVTCGTDSHTFATMDAGLAVDGELLVGDHLTVEIAADNMAHHPR